MKRIDFHELGLIGGVTLAAMLTLTTAAYADEAAGDPPDGATVQIWHDILPVLVDEPPVDEGLNEDGTGDESGAGWEDSDPGDDWVDDGLDDGAGDDEWVDDGSNGDDGWTDDGTGDDDWTDDGTGDDGSDDEWTDDDTSGDDDWTGDEGNDGDDWTGEDDGSGDDGIETGDIYTLGGVLDELPDGIEAGDVTIQRDLTSDILMSASGAAGGSVAPAPRVTHHAHGTSVTTAARGKDLCLTREWAWMCEWVSGKSN